MPLFPLILSLSLSIFLLTLPSTLSTTCTTNLPYKTCKILPSLKSTLHYTYTSSNSTLSVAFTATPPSPTGWVAWGINPTGTGMPGSQALVAFKSPTDGSLTVSTFNLSSYSEIIPGPLSFKVYDKRAMFNSADGSITIFADVKSAGGEVNNVWQVGPGVTNGFPQKHEIKAENLQSKLTIDLSSSGGDSGNSTGTGSGSSAGSGSSSAGDFGLNKRNTHGILNAISWGLLFPLGGILSRYLRTFEAVDPTLFYLHATCQTSAYVIGVAGWATGLQLGSESIGVVFRSHRCIGIVLFGLATLQV